MELGHAHAGMDMNSTMNTTMDPHHGHNMGTTSMMNHGDHDMSPGGGHNHGPMNPNETDRTCAGDMMMFFHTGKCEYVLFEALKTTSAGEMVGACFAIFAVAILYEGLKVLREYLLQRAMVNRYAVQEYNNGAANSDTKILGTQNPGAHFDRSSCNKQLQSKKKGGGLGTHMISAGHFIQTFLHMIQVFISYCLMLVFMTYNAWLCIAVVIGAGVGYFLFGWRKAIVVDINEHCH